jgi:hypothetical protein
VMNEGEMSGDFVVNNDGIPHRTGIRAAFRASNIPNPVSKFLASLSHVRQESTATTSRIMIIREWRQFEATCSNHDTYTCMSIRRHVHNHRYCLCTD